MKRVIKRLDKIHEKLTATVTPLDEKLFAQPPAGGGWSAAQILQHLCLVEERVTKDLEKAISRPARRVSFVRRFVPTSIVALRLVRVRAPQAVNPESKVEEDSTTAPACKDEVMANYNRARNDLKKLCATHGEDRFRPNRFQTSIPGRDKWRRRRFFRGLSRTATLQTDS